MKKIGAPFSHFKQRWTLYWLRDRGRERENHQLRIATSLHDLRCLCKNLFTSLFFADNAADISFYFSFFIFIVGVKLSTHCEFIFTKRFMQMLKWWSGMKWCFRNRRCALTQNRTWICTRFFFRILIRMTWTNFNEMQRNRTSRDNITTIHRWTCFVLLADLVRFGKLKFEKEKKRIVLMHDSWIYRWFSSDFIYIFFFYTLEYIKHSF